MSFHSLEYALFLPLVFALYWALSHRLQNPFLLLASYVFYGYVHAWFLGLILLSTAVDYGCARAIARGGPGRRRYLFTSIAFNLGLLGTFKYFGFFVENAAAACAALGLPFDRPSLSLVLPVGISFYTFQTLGYTIDVYRGRIEARRNPIDYALYVAFFPQLVAGPIERAERLLPQIEAPRRFECFHL